MKFRGLAGRASPPSVPCHRNLQLPAGSHLKGIRLYAAEPAFAIEQFGDLTNISSRRVARESEEHKQDVRPMQNICHPGPTPQNIDTTIVIHFPIAYMPQCKTLYVICIKMQLSLKASASERIPGCFRAAHECLSSTLRGTFEANTRKPDHPPLRHRREFNSRPCACDSRIARLSRFPQAWHRKPQCTRER